MSFSASLGTVTACIFLLLTTVCWGENELPSPSDTSLPTQQEPSPISAEGDHNEDIKPIPWADVTTEPDRQLLDLLVSKGYFSDFPEHRFQPDQPMSRAEFVSLLYRAAGMNTPFVSDFAYYRDVPTDYWAYTPIEGFRMRRWVEGSRSGYFYPDAPITRMDASLMLGATVPDSWLRLTEEEIDKTLHAYADVPELTAPAARLHLATVIFGGFLGPSITVSPDGSTSEIRMALGEPLTRIKAARVIYRRSLLEDDQAPSVTPKTLALAGGITLQISPTSAIAAEQLVAGQNVYFALTEGVALKAIHTLLPRGSRLHGVITDWDPGSRNIHVTFDKLIMPSGNTWTLKAEWELTLPPRNKDKLTFVVPGDTFEIVTQESETDKHP